AFNFEKFRELYYKGIFTPKQDGLSKKVIFDIEDICTKWLSGLAWITSYYRGGIGEVNPGWFYPYHRTPLMVDVVRVLRKNLDRIPKSMQEQEGKGKKTEKKGKKEKPRERSEKERSRPPGLEEEEKEEKEETREEKKEKEEK